ncbi:MAG: hypothetical protein CMG60_01940 [Candidatus Marinimicrobia bacterium]|nr:hypothetical protein [Candidatus Neomarinimicrobiota bacterium]
MDFRNQIEMELYFADHFDTILYPLLSEIYFEKNDLVRARKVCDIGLKHHPNDPSGLFMLAKIEKLEGNLKTAEKLLEDVIIYSFNHLAAAEMLCEIQTVLGRAQNRLLKTWKHILKIDPNHLVAKDFVYKVEKKNKKITKISEEKEVKEKKPIAKSKGKTKIRQPSPKLTPTKSSPKIDDYQEPLKVSSRLATFTLVSVLRNQGLFSQALEVLEVLEAKGENSESISLERDTINTLIEKSKKDQQS